MSAGMTCRDCGTTGRLDTDNRCPYCAELWQLDCTLKPRPEPGKTAIRVGPDGYYLNVDLRLNRLYHLLSDDTWVETLGDGASWQEIKPRDPDLPWPMLAPHRM